MRSIVLTLSVCCLLLAALGCVSDPVRAPRGDRELAPTTAADRPDQYVGHTVEWGGTIVSALNRKDSTELQILGYPLQSSSRPDLGSSPVGRFLVRYPGYLETEEFKPGREVTVAGRLAGTHLGKIGEADYLFPVVDSGSVKLWDRRAQRSSTAGRVGIGIGSGSYGSGWSIGVGF